MSLIHDALRRGQAPAGGRSPRAAHPDSVLAALGYHSEPKPRLRLKMILGLFVAIAGVAYIILAFNHGVPTPVTKAPMPRATPPARRMATPAAPPVVTQPRVVTPPPVHEPAPIHQAPAAAVSRPPVHPPTRPAARPSTSVSVPSKSLPATTPPAASATAPDDFQLALYYQRSGDFEQALVHYKAVIGRDELNVEAHNNLGRLYLDKGLTDDAIREFRRVTAIDPRYVRARINLAAAYFKQSRYDVSAAEARAALAIEPRNVDALVNLALAEKAAGQIDDARESLLAALRIDQHNAAAHYNLARQYEEVGESALALSHYRAFLKYAGPDQAEYAADVRGRIAALSAKIK